MKRKFDQHALDKLTFDGAYVLGFIFADGCVHINSKRYRYFLKLTTKDYDVLKSIAVFFKSKNAIYSTKVGNKKYFTVSFASKHLVRVLGQYGCGPNKSLTIGPPNIPKKFWLPFLLGVFDGDGCIWQTSSGAYSVEFVSGSKNFIQWISDYLDELYIPHTKITKTNAHRIKISSSVVVKYFLKLLYKSIGNIKPLKRKQKAFEVMNKKQFTNRHAPYYQLWEKEILANTNLTNEQVVKKIKRDKRNLGWVRSLQTVQRHRKRLVAVI